MNNKLPKFIKREFTVDPYRSFAALAISFNIEGYRFLSMTRKLNKATVKFQRIE